MAGNTVNLEFAGDAAKLAKAGKQAEMATAGVGKSATEASDGLEKASREADTYTDRVGRLGAGVTGMTDAFDSAGAAVQGLADLQSAGVERAQRLARAANDVSQAMEDQQQAIRDANQAMIDGDQAALDLEQAQLDAASAQRDYNEAVREHGKNSIEARQAQLDLKQAGIDMKQAQEDSAQALRDASQASIDAEAATLDLAEAQREANPPQLQQWADQIGMITPLLSGLVGVVGLVTAAQWAWNAAQLASPTTWIILLIVGLIAIIVAIAVKTDWFSKLWKGAWGGIKSAASATWDFIKKIPGWTATAFKTIGKAIALPFQIGFAAVKWAWNNTIGKLSWTVPGWVPGIGGNTISAPKLHQGGIVPGAPGTEVVTVLQAGERVTSMAGSVSGGREDWVRLDMGELGEVLLDSISRAVGRRGGSVTALGVKIRSGGVVT